MCESKIFEKNIPDSHLTEKNILDGMPQKKNILARIETQKNNPSRGENISAQSGKIFPRGLRPLVFCNPYSSICRYQNITSAHFFYIVLLLN